MAVRLMGQQNSRLQEFLQDVANGRSSGRMKSLVRMQRRRWTKFPGHVGMTTLIEILLEMENFRWITRFFNNRYLYAQTHVNVEKGTTNMCVRNHIQWSVTHRSKTCSHQLDSSHSASVFPQRSWFGNFTAGHFKVTFPGVRCRCHQELHRILNNVANPFLHQAAKSGQATIVCLCRNGKRSIAWCCQRFQQGFWAGHGFMIVYGHPVSMSGEIPASSCQRISTDPVGTWHCFEGIQETSALNDAQGICFSSLERTSSFNCRLGKWLNTAMFSLMGNWWWIQNEKT